RPAGRGTSTRRAARFALPRVAPNQTGLRTRTTEYGSTGADQGLRPFPASSPSARDPGRRAAQHLRPGSRQCLRADRVLELLLDLPSASSLLDDPRLRLTGPSFGGALAR